MSKCNALALRQLLCRGTWANLTLPCLPPAPALSLLRCSSADGQCLWQGQPTTSPLLFHLLVQKETGQHSNICKKGSHPSIVGTGSTHSTTRQVTWDTGPSVSHPSDMTPPVRGRFKVLLYLPAVNGLIKVTERRSYGCLLKFYY